MFGSLLSIALFFFSFLHSLPSLKNVSVAIEKADRQSFDSISGSSDASVEGEADTKQQLDNDVERPSELSNNTTDPGKHSPEMPVFKGQIRVTSSGVNSRQGSAAGSKRVDKASSGTSGAATGKGPAPPVAPKTKASVGRVTSQTEALKEESTRKPAQNGTEKKQSKSPTTRDQPNVFTKPTDKLKMSKKTPPEVLPKPSKTLNTSVSPDASVSSPPLTRETAQAERSKSSSSNSVTKPQSPPSSPGKSETKSPVKKDTTVAAVDVAPKSSHTRESKKEKDLKGMNTESKIEQPVSPSSLEETKEINDSKEGAKLKSQPQTPTEKNVKSRQMKVSLSKSSKVINKTEIDNKPHTTLEAEQPAKSSTKDKSTNETRTPRSPKKPKAEASPTGSRLPRITPPSTPKRPTEDESDYGEDDSPKQPSLSDARPENDDSFSVNSPLSPGTFAERDQAVGNAVVKALPETKPSAHLNHQPKPKLTKEVEKVKVELAANTQTPVHSWDQNTDEGEEKQCVSVETTANISDLEMSAQVSDENKDKTSVAQVKDQRVNLNKDMQSPSVQITESTADMKTLPQVLQKEAQDVTMKTTEASVDLKTPPETEQDQVVADLKTPAQVSKWKIDKPETELCADGKINEHTTVLKLSREVGQRMEKAQTVPSVDTKTKGHKPDLKLTHEVIQKVDNAETVPIVYDKTKENKTDFKLTQEAEQKPVQAKVKAVEKTTDLKNQPEKETQAQDVQKVEQKALSWVSESKTEKPEKVQSAKVEKAKNDSTDQVSEQKVDQTAQLPEADVKDLENKADVKAQSKVSKQKGTKGKEVSHTSVLTPSQTSEQEVDKVNKSRDVSVKSKDYAADLNDLRQVSDQVRTENVAAETKPEANDSKLTKPLDVGTAQEKPDVRSKGTLLLTDEEKVAPETVAEMSIKPTASVHKETKDLKTGSVQKSATAQVTQEASKSFTKSESKEQNNLVINGLAVDALFKTTEEAGHKEAEVSVSAQDRKDKTKGFKSSSTEIAAMAHGTTESVKEDVKSKPVRKTELELVNSGNLGPNQKPVVKRAEQPKATDQVTSQMEKTTEHKKISSIKQIPDFKKSQNSPNSEKLPPPCNSSPKMMAQDFLLASKNRSKSESPSSWLDVDQGFEKKQNKTERKMDCSASDESLQDTSDDSEDFIRKIKELCSPFSFPPKKHGQSRMISPPFALPAIKEDHFEKTFDPEEFKFGIRKTTGPKDLSPAMLIKKSSEDVRNKQLSKRKATEESMIFKALASRRGQEKSDTEKTTENNENGENQGNNDSSGKVSSRLERMSILSNLMNTPKNLRKPQTEPEAVATTPPTQQVLTPGDTNSVAKVSEVAPPGREEGKMGRERDFTMHPGTTAESIKSPLTPPSLPNFSEIKLPDILGKYLKTDQESPTSGSSQKSETPFLFPAVQTDVSSGVPDTKASIEKFPKPPAPVFPPRPAEQQTKLPSPTHAQVSRNPAFQCSQYPRSDLILERVRSTLES